MPTVEEVIKIEPPNREQATAAFGKFKGEITANLPDALAIAWFGSTSINIAGKNNLDVLVFVRPEALQSSASLCQENMGFKFDEKANEPFREKNYMFLQRVSDIPINLHLTSNIVEFFLPLIFKDYLSLPENRALAKEYEEQKYLWQKEVAREIGSDATALEIRQAFTAKKTPYVARVMSEAFKHNPVAREMLTELINQHEELKKYYRESKNPHFEIDAE
jgi:hypothetical protein